MKYFICKAIVSVFLPLALLAQTENWVYRYDGPGNWNHGDLAWSVVYGADGNIYAAGYSYDDSTDNDFAVISLTTAGDTNWVYLYNGSGNGGDAAWSIVYGADGNIYAAGTSTGSGTNSDFTVISLTTVGDTNWVYRYNGPGNDADSAYSIVYGADGNIYAAGMSTRSGANYDFTVISLTTAGETNWVYLYNGPGNLHDKAWSIVYGADGNIYAAGMSTGIIDDFTVISLTTAGDTNWVYRYDGPGAYIDGARSIVYGADGNIYAAGYSYGGSHSEYDFTVISLTTAGDTNWVYRYSGPVIFSHDAAFSIVYGADSNIYATGYSTSIGTNRDFTVISLTTAGDTNWVYCYERPLPGSDMARSIVYGADGNIYAAGWPFIVISLTTAGDTNWVYRYAGPAGYGDDAKSLVYGADGNIYAAGGSHASFNCDFIVISLPPDLSVNEENTDVRNNYYSTTIFSGPLLLPESKNSKVFDITGRVVTPQNIKPGIYFIEIDGVISHKIIKIK